MATIIQFPGQHRTQSHHEEVAEAHEKIAALRESIRVKTACLKWWDGELARLLAEETRHG